MRQHGHSQRDTSIGGGCLGGALAVSGAGALLGFGFHKTPEIAAQQRWSMSHVTRNGVRLFYTDAGVGEPQLLLVHDWSCDHT